MRMASIVIFQPGLAKLTTGTVIGDVLFQRIQLAAQIFHTPLQQVADGENPQEFTVVVGDRQMPEVEFPHYAHGAAEVKHRLYEKSHSCAGTRAPTLGPSTIPEFPDPALEYFSIFHHQLHIFQGLDTPRGIAIHGNEIRAGSWPPLWHVELQARAWPSARLSPPNQSCRQLHRRPLYSPRPAQFPTVLYWPGSP